MMRRFNYRFLLGLTTAVVIGAAAVVVVHAWQVRREAASLLAEAGRAEEGHQAPGRAVEFLKRYLIYAPNDVDALDRYGRLLASRTRTAADRERLLSVYEKILERDAGRKAVRRAAADLAMQQGFFARARTHLEALIHDGPSDGELNDLLGQCQEALGDAEKAAASYSDAVADAPDRIDAYTRLARLLRGPLNRPSEADQVMDDLVAANDRAPAAYLDRAAYRVAYGSLDDAERDAARARELAPDDARALLTTADLAARRGRADDARTALRRGLGLYPKDLGLRLALATLDLGTDRPDEAADCLEEGKKLLKDSEPAPDLSGLLTLLAEARLQQGRTRDVDELAAEARESGAVGTADYLDARLDMYRGRWETASRVLEDYAKTSVMSVDQGVRTLLCAATCYERLGDGDRRLAALRQAVGLAPSSAAAGAALGAALLDAGRTDEALDELRGVTALPQAPEAAWALLARALLLHNQALPRDQRDWPEVDQALDRAGPTPEAARLRAAALRARDEPGEATAVLERAWSQHPDRPDAWTNLALDAAQRGDAAKAASLLANARRRLGDRVEFRLAALRTCAGAEGEKTLQDLEKGLDGFTPEERTLLLSRLAETYYRIGKASEGDRLCRLLASAPATDLSGRLLLMEAALSSEDDALVNAVLADVARLEGEGGAWQRYGRAAYLVTRAYRGDRSGLYEARTLLADVARLRPEWSRVALLQGRLGQLEGDAATARDGYQRAFDLGERRLDVALPLTQMLTALGRWDDADRVFRKLQEQMAPRGALARRAAEVALQTHNDGRAAELARLAAPADDTYTYHIWIGNLLTAVGRPSDGEDELRRAAAFPNAGWDATAALAASLAGRDRRREAEAVVGGLKAKLPERYAALPLARCYEAAGRLDLAERYYGEAVNRRPDDGATLIAAATFHLRLDHAGRAESLLRRLPGPGVEASAADLAWARRELAMVLAADGGDAKVDEAAAVLGAGPKPGEDAAAFRRARAFVLGARPEGREQALRLLEEAGKLGPLPPDEQFRQARMYDAAGDWPQAREQLVGVLTSDRRNPEYLAYLIDGLLRHDAADEAGPWIARLEGLEPGSARVKEYRARAKAAEHEGPSDPRP